MVQYIDLEHLELVPTNVSLKKSFRCVHTATAFVPPVLCGVNNTWSGTSRPALIFLEAIPLSHFRRSVPRVKTKGKLSLYLIMQHIEKTCG